MQARGLENVGNTCFLNAGLQVLLHLEPFVEALLLDEPSLSNGSLQRSARLYHRLFAAHPDALQPTEHIATLRRRIPR